MVQQELHQYLIEETSPQATHLAFATPSVDVGLNTLHLQQYSQNDSVPTSAGVLGREGRRPRACLAWRHSSGSASAIENVSTHCGQNTNIFRNHTVLTYSPRISRVPRDSNSHPLATLFTIAGVTRNTDPTVTFRHS